jgi:hypothetical protein
MPEDATWPVATPEQMLHAWNEGCMGTIGLPNYVQTARRAHPIPRQLHDPIFHTDSKRPNNGWSRARDIRSTTAIASTRRWLEHKGLRPHPEVEAAWDRTERRSAAVAPIESECRIILTQAWDEPDVETREDFVDYLIRHLEDYREALR